LILVILIICLSIIHLDRLVREAQEEIKLFHSKYYLHTDQRKEALQALHLWNLIDAELAAFQSSLATLDAVMGKWTVLATEVNKEMKELGDFELMCQTIEHQVLTLLHLKGMGPAPTALAELED
jgi:hypothetical protein